MKGFIYPVAAGLLLGACASPHRPQAAPGAQAIGVPERVVDTSVVAAALGEGGTAPEAEAIQLPERITLPASYRLMLVDGHLALVRETDPKVLDAGPGSLSVVAGEIARGDLAYQPGLLQQELAAQVASNRESSARMDNALESVMQRSRELSDQASELKAQAEKLGALLAAAQSRTSPDMAKAALPAAAAADGREKQTPGSLSPESPSNPQN
jgi:hypothetical protein